MNHWSAHLALAILAVEHEARKHVVSRNNARQRLARRFEIESRPRQGGKAAALLAMIEAISLRWLDD